MIHGTEVIDQIKWQSQFFVKDDLWNFYFIIDKDHLVVDKGSISINGISLTTNKLSESELFDLEASIKSKINTDISIDNIKDKKILGGIKLKVGNTLIAGSISTKLEKLKQSMINK